MISIHSYALKFWLKQQNILQTLHTEATATIITVKSFRQEVNDVKNMVIFILIYNVLDFAVNVNVTLPSESLPEQRAAVL